jgi:hypothetical protein
VEIRRYFWGVSNIAQSEPLGLRLIRIVTDWWWIRPKVRHSTGTEAVAAEARWVAAHGWNKMDVTALLITAATNSRRTLSGVRVHSRRRLRGAFGVFEFGCGSNEAIGWTGCRSIASPLKVLEPFLC